MSEDGAAYYERLVNRFRKGRVRGLDLDGKKIAFDLERLLEAAAIEELDGKEWVALTADLELDKQLFPFSRETGSLIPPIERLLQAMEADQT